MKISESLTIAKELINNPENWTKEASARDQWGNETLTSSGLAVCFCLYGAINRSLYKDWIPGDPIEVIEERVKALTGSIRNVKKAILRETFSTIDSIVSFNDKEETKHEDVIKVLDTAIRLAEEEEAVGN